METLRGHFLVPTVKNPDKKLWFIFHHESDGIIAFDITTEHPSIPYSHFEKVIDSEDRKLQRDKIVLQGGPMQSDDALIILHNNPFAGNSTHVINDHFAFWSYRFVLLPGKPPLITNSADMPTRIDTGSQSDFIVSLGFRVWDMPMLEQELQAWQWTFLPATREIVFNTSRQERLQKALLSIN